MRIFIATFLGLSFILSVKSQGYQQCHLRDQSIGICRHVLECPSVKNDLKRGLHPRICGFSGRYPIVCCDQNSKKNPGKISEEKCLEYLELDIKTTIKSETKRRNSRDLTIPSVSGGSNAYYEEYTHMAVLGYGQLENIDFKCGGSLISEQFVLTAGHCLESQDGPVSFVRLGDLDLGSETEPAEPQNFKVIETFTPPEYNFISVYHDIGLIKLDRPVIFTRYVKPACLETKSDFQYDYFTISGWGATEYGGRFQSYLQDAIIYKFPKINCTRSYRPQFRLEYGFDEDSQICAGDPESNVDTCQGDSGGPIQTEIQYYPKTYKIVGVTSFGKYCGLVPGIYTKVSKYIPWIESIVWPN